MDTMDPTGDEKTNSATKVDSPIRHCEVFVGLDERLRFVQESVGPNPPLLLPTKASLIANMEAHTKKERDEELRTVAKRICQASQAGLSSVILLVKHAENIQTLEEYVQAQGMTLQQKNQPTCNCCKEVHIEW